MHAIKIIKAIVVAISYIFFRNYNVAKRLVSCKAKMPGMTLTILTKNAPLVLLGNANSVFSSTVT